MATVKKGWKEKTTYRIVAPESFDQQEIGATISSDESSLIGRTIDISLKDLTGDKTKQYLKVVFEIFKIEDGKAKTRFKRFYTSQQYLRSRIRKGMSKIESEIKLKLSDANVWVKVVIATQKKVQTSKSIDMNKRVLTILEKHRDMKINDFLQMALFGKLGTDIYHNIKRISPTKRVEIEEIRLL